MSSSKASRVLGVPCSILLRSETFLCHTSKLIALNLLALLLGHLYQLSMFCSDLVRTSSNLLETFTSTVQRHVQILLMHLITLDTSLSTSYISLNKVL